jgi:preprotein translocase subunit SecB
MNEESGKVFKMQRLYVKDVSFESPGVPDIFRKRVEPSVEMQFRVSSAPFTEDKYEVVVTATITARAEERTVFLLEAQQAGIFVVKGMVGEELAHMLHVFCPAQLFPFLREVVAELTQKGGFPPVLLAPVRFEDVWKASRQQAGA